MTLCTSRAGKGKQTAPPTVCQTAQQRNSARPCRRLILAAQRKGAARWKRRRCSKISSPISTRASGRCFHQACWPAARAIRCGTSAACSATRRATASWSTYGSAAPPSPHTRLPREGGYSIFHSTMALKRTQALQRRSADATAARRGLRGLLHAALQGGGVRRLHTGALALCLRGVVPQLRLRVRAGLRGLRSL